MDYFNALNIMVKTVLLLCLSFSLVVLCHIPAKISPDGCWIIDLKFVVFAVVRGTCRRDYLLKVN